MKKARAMYARAWLLGSVYLGGVFFVLLPQAII
jgi:hypothetical protein